MCLSSPDPFDMKRRSRTLADEIADRPGISLERPKTRIFQNYPDGSGENKLVCDECQGDVFYVQSHDLGSAKFNAQCVKCKSVFVLNNFSWASTSLS